MSEILENLESSGFLRYYALFPGKSNGGVYQLTDRFSLFHQTLIRKNRRMNEHFWSDLRETPKNKVRAFQAETATRGTPHITFVSTYGLKRKQYATIVQSEVTLDDLFSAPVC